MAQNIIISQYILEFRNLHEDANTLVLLPCGQKQFLAPLLG